MERRSEGGARAVARGGFDRGEERQERQIESREQEKERWTGRKEEVHKEGRFSDKEKKIVVDAQKELGNKWTEIAERLPGRSGKQVEHCWQYHLKWEIEGEVHKEGPFSDEEKIIVVYAQKELGNKWAEIAERLPGRSRNQVSSWWHYQLKREIEREVRKEGPFTDEEKRIVVDAQKELGNKWTEIAERLPGRSECEINKWWHNHLKWGNEHEEGPFTDEEKRIVVDAQKELGDEWAEIAEQLPGRSGRQVRDWWHNRLYAQKERERRGEGRARTGAFTKEEERIVIDAQGQLGNKWTQIAEWLPGRSESQVRSCWLRHIRAQKKKGERSNRRKAHYLHDNIVSEEETRAVADGGYDCQKVRGYRQEEDEPSMRESIKGISYNGKTYEGTMTAAEMQLRNISQEEQRTAATTNLYAGQNINEITSEQAVQMHLHQLMLLGNGTTPEMMVGAIDDAIVQEVQRTASANNFLAQTMVEKDERKAGIEAIIAEKDLESMHLKNVIAPRGAKGKEAKKKPNLHARQNINGMTSEQAMQVHLRQLILLGKRTTHEMMMGAIDEAVAQEVQGTVSANIFHTRMMAETDERKAGIEGIIAEKDLERMHLKSANARVGTKGKEANNQRHSRDQDGAPPSQKPLSKEEIMEVERIKKHIRQHAKKALRRNKSNGANGNVGAWARLPNADSWWA